MEYQTVSKDSEWFLFLNWYELDTKKFASKSYV